MEIDEFRSDFASQIKIAAMADANFIHSAFVDVAVSYLEEAGEVSDFSPCYYRGISRRRNVAVDGYAFDKADASLRLFLADLTYPAKATLTQTDAKKKFGSLIAFAEEAIAGHLEDTIDDNSPARGLADELQQRAGAIARIRAFLLTDAALSSRVRDWPEGFIGDIPVEFHIWDITRFHRAFSSKSGQDELIVEFGQLSAGGVPCIQAQTGTNDYESYLCILPGPVLADIYDLYGSRLLEGNVRAFLSAKGKINKGIRNTVLNDPGMFFAYNNGIAATATSVSVTAGEEGSRLICATDLQIVNGGQTTASLAASRRSEKANLEQVFVPMKLSVMNAERSLQMIPQIAKFANSQNKVNEADFFSNSPYHVRLEIISRRLWAPAKGGAQHETRWFYERARGQFPNATASMTAAERKRFMEMNPRDQVITKTDLAKSENSWNELPQKVSQGAQSSFLYFAERITEKWSSDEAEFNEDYFRNIVARVILFRETERIVSAQKWYSGGYRANIVTYSISKLAYETKRHTDKELNFREIWQMQALPPALEQQIAIIAKIVYDEITAPQAGHENVTQWCKKDACWMRVRSAPCELTAAYLKDLVKKDEVRAVSKAAKAMQVLDNGIDAQATVVTLGSDYWLNLLDWGSARKVISAEDVRLVRLASGVTGAVPTEWQSKKLLILKQRLEAEGFAPTPQEIGP